MCQELGGVPWGVTEGRRGLAGHAGSCGQPVPARPAAAGECALLLHGALLLHWALLKTGRHCCSLRTAHLIGTCPACRFARLPAAAAGAALRGACRTPASGPASHTSSSPPPPVGCTPWCCSDRTSPALTPCAAQPAPVLQAAPGHCRESEARRSARAMAWRGIRKRFALI